MAITGNTIRLTFAFTDWDNVAADPTNIVLRVYDAEKRLLGAAVTLTTAHKVATGVYQYDYLVPAGKDELFVEISGTSGGTTVLNRERIERNFYSED